ncbi:MAG: hypothetical protein M3O92_01040 [Actinomycetota bacterium]|nr:hypothetical protein [Actinomycetota bacterium]
MTELNLLRREFEAVPDPDATSVASAREALLREIAPAPEERYWPILRLALAGAIAVVAVVVGMVVAIPRKDALPRTDVAAAAYRAATPAHRIRHEIYRTVSDKSNGLTERWVSTSAPLAFRMMTPPVEYTISRCGEMIYDSRPNLLVVTNARIGPTAARSYVAFDDPLQRYLRDYRSGAVRYRGQATFHGIPAYKLTVSRGGAKFTYLVRRSNYYPLQTILKDGQTIVTTTYLRFEYVPRNSGTETLLRMSLHRGAFLIHSGGFMPRGECKGFGSYDSITGNGKAP